jgi:putative hydrolase of the HAD superfamily
MKGKTNNSNIKAFLFDLGNVIIPFDNYIAAREIKKYTNRSVQGIYDTTLDSSIVKDFSEGKVNSEDFFIGIKEILGLNENITYQKFKSIWNSIFLKEDEKVGNLVKKLGKEYKIILVSNINKIHYDYIRENFKIMEQIKEQVLSYKVGVNKPHPKI